MNNSAASYIDLPAIEVNVDARTEDQDTLLGRFYARLISCAKSSQRDNPVYREAVSFTDENLLDPVMGPEISRTLRR